MPSTNNSKACWNCGEQEGKHQRCSRCQKAMYCLRECQASHWKAEHKQECSKLQVKKANKDEKKSNKKMLDTMAMAQMDMADSMASMLASSAARMSANVKNPRDRAFMEKFAKDMHAAVAEEKQKKREGKVDTSWIHDEEHRKKSIDLMGQMPPPVNGKMMRDALNGNPKTPDDPISQSTKKILKYTLPLSSTNALEPQSVAEIVGNVEPVIGACGIQLQHFSALNPKVANDFVKKRHKLSSHVAVMKASPKREQDAYTVASLVQIEKKWRNQVSELFAYTLKACSKNETLGIP